MALWEAPPLKHGAMFNVSRVIMRFKKHQIIEISELTDASYVWEVLQSQTTIGLIYPPRGLGPRSGRPKAFSTFSSCRCFRWAQKVGPNVGVVSEIATLVGSRRSARMEFWYTGNHIGQRHFPFAKSRGQEFAVETASFDAQQLDMGTSCSHGKCESWCVV